MGIFSKPDLVAESAQRSLTGSRRAEALDRDEGHVDWWPSDDDGPDPVVFGPGRRP